MMNNYSATDDNGTLMTRMNMMNTDKILFNHNYQRSIFLTSEKLPRGK